jgi:hypothetical protein
MSNGCRDCRAGLEHCHGTLIDHALGGSECTERDCTGSGLVSHAFAVGCGAVGCGCGEPVAI